MSNHLGLSDEVLTVRVISPVNVVNTGANGVTIDLGQNSTRGGWLGARFVISVGVLGTNGTMDAKVVQSNTSAFTINALCVDVDTNTNAALTQVVNSNTVQIIDVYRPKNRYLRLVATGHANGSLGGVTCDLYRTNGTLPPTQLAEQYVKVRES